MRAAGEPVNKLQAAITDLPKVEYDATHTAGLEAEVYRQKLAALTKAVAAR